MVKEENRGDQRTPLETINQVTAAINRHELDSMLRFFEEGDKVKITLRFRGREMAHQELGYSLLNRVKVDTGSFAKVESEPRFEGRQMVMLLAPR